MTFSLKLWTNPRDENDVRLYVNGTTRSAVYLKRSRTDGRLVWSSKANDTPPKFRTGDHYGKVGKDGDAARMVAEALGLRLGEDDWTQAVAVAESGLQVEG